MLRLVLPSLVSLVVGCSLILQPEDAIQCTTDQDCASFGGRVCQESFCVLAADGPADGSVRSDATPQDPSDATSDAEVDAATPQALEPNAGDVVMFMPSGIVSADHDRVTEWNNSVRSAYLHSALIPDVDGASDPQPFLVEEHGNACVGFQVGQRLVLADDSAGALRPTGDFSVMAVVATPALENGNYSSGGRIPIARVHVDSADSEAFLATGWAVRTAWQHDDLDTNKDRYAASLVPVGGTVTPSNAKEVVDPELHDAALHVVTLLLRHPDGDGTPLLHLLVDGTERGTALALNVSQPATADLTLGSILGPPYQWAAYGGEVCAVIVHHGVQSDAELSARTQALASKFGTP